ncbi:PRP38-domain-containing protein [Viridothelium virens]|uniref:Pre-mRNA-splicing factor 38 n=1 Tax=Viridothelium virens TaxID=1048519 RepID=A0A6A6H6Z7_VIRVR|nr:PRP38-domain-containing protein [Viridothelium virens]
MAAHQADAKRMLDDRGYTGTLIRGQNPALLFEKAVRDRITESYYWKEQCFGLNAATLCDRAVELTFIGGTYGVAQKPTPFLCLAFKMLQLTPDKEVVEAYLNWGSEVFDRKAEDDAEGDGLEQLDGGEVDHARRQKTIRAEFKYLRALAAFYIRLTWEPVDIFKTLEPLLEDRSRLRQRKRDGVDLTFMDEFIDRLLTRDRVCATTLWKLPDRGMLQDLDMLEEYVSPLGEELEELDRDEEGEGGDSDVEEVQNGRSSSDDGELANGNGHASDSSESSHSDGSG